MDKNFDGGGVTVLTSGSATASYTPTVSTD